MDNRYFIVFWQGVKKGSQTFGSIVTGQDNGDYINHKQTIEDIKEANGLDVCIIYNIIEINEKDMKTFMA